MKNEFQEYIDFVNSLKGRFKLKYYSSKGILAFQERQKSTSKIEAMILGSSDYVVTCSLFDDLSFGIGFDVRGKLCEADDAEVERVLELARHGKTFGEADVEKAAKERVEDDVYFLRDTEGKIYRLGLKLPNPSAVFETF